MAMDLHNEKGEYFRFNIFSWRKILALAKQYGWKPIGTDGVFHGENTGDLWAGGYLSNEGNAVKHEDAQAMAEALKLALCDMVNSSPEDCGTAESPEITNDPFIKELMKTFGSTDSDIEQRVLEAASKSPIEFFRGEAEGQVKAFIHFCREGSFTIW
jgi:hypothetical protein